MMRQLILEIMFWSFKRLLISTHAQKFISSIWAKRETPHLEIVVQSKGERLRDYVARFNMEALSMPYLEDSQAIEAIMKDKYIQ